MLDINLFIEDRGGNPEIVRESQRRRGASVEIVDEVIALYKEWVKSKDPYRHAHSPLSASLGSNVGSRQSSSRATRRTKKSTRFKRRLAKSTRPRKMQANCWSRRNNCKKKRKSLLLNPRKAKPLGKKSLARLETLSTLRCLRPWTR